MAFTDRSHQVVQFRDLLIAESTLYHNHQTDLIQRGIGIRLVREVVQLVPQILFHLSGSIKDLHLGLEEVLNFLQCFLAVEQGILTLQHTINQSDVILLLRQNICHQLDSLLHLAAIRVLPARIISFIQRLIVRFLFFKLLHDESDQPVFVIWNIHHIEVFPEKLSDLFHLDCCHDLPLGDAGLSDLCALAQHIRQLGIGRLDSCSAVFDRDLLLGD